MQHDAVDLALEHAGVVQIQHALDEHLGAAIDAGGERLGVDGGIPRRIVAEPRQQGAKVLVVALAQHQGLGHRFAQRADADLQRAAVRHDARRVQPGRIVAEHDRLARRREQRKVRGRPVEHEIEFFRRDRGVARHERQLRIGLAGEQKVGAAGAAQRQQIERQVGIAAETVRSRRFIGAMRHQLGDHIGAAVEDVAQRMRIVRRNIVLLRVWRVEPLPGFKEEFVDLDVRRHPLVANGGGVIERRIAGEQPPRHRIEETVFEIAVGARRFERQRGENGQRYRAVGHRLGEQRIGDVIGLAEAKRQRQHDGLADFFDDCLGEPRRIVECPWRRPDRGMNHCRVSQPGSGWKRGPYCRARPLRVSRTAARPRLRA